MQRKVKRIVTGTKQVDGAGVELTRVIGKPDVKDFDPFLMLDAFDHDDPSKHTKGFPWHPHRGIETVTYRPGRKWQPRVTAISPAPIFRP